VAVECEPESCVERTDVSTPPTAQPWGLNSYILYSNNVFKVFADFLILIIFPG